MINGRPAEVPAANLHTTDESLIHEPAAEAEANRMDPGILPDENLTDAPEFPKLRPEITLRNEPDVADKLLENFVGNGV